MNTPQEVRDTVVYEILETCKRIEENDAAVQLTGVLIKQDATTAGIDELRRLSEVLNDPQPRTYTTAGMFTGID